MTLREELPQRTQEHPFSRINHDLHNEIAIQVEQFLKSGGRINEVPVGASGRKLDGAAVVVNDIGELVPFKKDAYEKNRKRARNHKKITDNTPLGMFPKPPKKKKARSNTGHLHISRKQDGTLIVRVLNRQVGTFKKEELEKAIKARDDYYAATGYPC